LISLMNYSTENLVMTKKEHDISFEKTVPDDSLQIFLKCLMGVLAVVVISTLSLCIYIFITTYK